MTGFKLPPDLLFNRGKIADPQAYPKECGAKSWLYIVGDEFASMPGGMSYEQVQQAVEHHARVISDPPREMTLELAKQHVAALDELPRPTLISCRVGPRSSAVAYMYAGLKAGADPEDVIRAAEQDQAPFCKFDEYKQWVRASMRALGGN